MSKPATYNNICSVFILFILTMFLFHLRYDVPLYGDDVSGLVSNNPDSTYIDDRIVEGECTLNLDYSLGATWKSLKRSYFSWNGRVTSKLIMPLVRVIFSFPDGVDWMLFGIYIAVMQLWMFLLVLQIICGSVKDGLGNPVIVLLAGLSIFFVPSYSYAYMTRIVMYTFTNIYVASVALYLCFYTLIRRVMERNEPPKVTTLIGINAVGLLAGLSHEAYGVIFGAVLLTQLGRFWFENHRRISVRYLFMYIGYILGFCICFFAPGNFNRASQSHEDALRKVSLLQRLLNSIYIHAFVAYKLWIMPVIVIPVLIVIAVIMLKKKAVTVKDILTAIKNNLEWFLGFAVSAIVWGLVASVAIYGMLAANVILIIGVTRVFLDLWFVAKNNIMPEEKRLEGARKGFAGFSIIVVLALTSVNLSELSSVHRTANVWRENIRQARETGAEEVTVPAYPDNLNYKFYDLEAINCGGYSKISYCVVYGTRILVE